MQRNTQVPEKQVRDGLFLSINSIFYTIQGEGPFAGSPAVFVRLAGCNLQCPLCDTEYTNRVVLPVQSVVERIYDETPGVPPPLVVITGGEPFRQNLYPLIAGLLLSNIPVQIETNGTLYVDLPFDHPKLTIVCSPKTGAINKKLVHHIKALKYVATAESLEDSPDGLPTHALEHPNGGILARPPKGFKGEIYLQPVDEKNIQKNHLNMQAVVKSCMDNHYRLCLQVHKIIGVD